MPTLRISDGAGIITVEVLGYEHPSPQTVDDANWLKCEVSAQVQGFSGVVSASLRVQEFAVFLEELQSCSAGNASSAIFESMEDWLALRAEFTESGRVKLKCTMAGQSGPMPSLSFRMELESGAVSGLVESIAEVLKAYPARLPATISQTCGPTRAD